MSKYIPALSPSVQTRMPLSKWKSEVKPFVVDQYEEITLSSRQEQLLLSAVTGDKESIAAMKQLFKGLKLYKQSKWRGYTFVYLVYRAAQNQNHLLSMADIRRAYNDIFSARCHTDYPIVIANYEAFYVVPTEDSQTFSVTLEEEEMPKAAINVAQMLQDLSKSNRKPKPVTYNQTALFNTEDVVEAKEQTLEELETTNKELEKVDMEFVFQYAHDKNLLRELMDALQTSTPDEDLQRSVDVFSQKSMMYDFFSFMRSKGISIA